jgi:hypothetical protein
VSATVRVDGVKETIAELRRLDPELRKTFNRRVKEIAKPIITAAQGRYRGQTYPSGTARNWQQRGRQIFPLDSSRAARGVTAQISTSKKNASTIAVVQKNAAAAVFEFARNGNLGAAFNSKNGTPARVMWPAAVASENKVAEEMTRYVEEVSDQITRNLL